MCILNETFEQQPNEQQQTTEFLLQGLESKCDYKLFFLDCDAMTTTTTTTTTTTIEITTIYESTSTVEATIESTSEIPVSTTTPWFVCGESALEGADCFSSRYFKYTKPPERSANNAKKLFTVLGTLVAITVVAIILVILWYRLKTIFKRRQKQKKMLDQQKHFSSPSPNNLHSTAPRYASSDMLSSLPSAQLTGSKSQSQALIAPASPPATVYQNADALANDSIQSYIDDESLHQQTRSLPEDDRIEIEANTQC